MACSLPPSSSASSSSSSAPPAPPSNGGDALAEDPRKGGRGLPANAAAGLVPMRLLLCRPMLSLARSLAPLASLRACVRSNSSAASSKLSHVAAILEEESNVPVEPKPSAYSEREHIYKPFRRGAHLIPHHLTHDDRVLRYRRTKRPLVGPPSGESRYSDYFHQLNINPLRECMNASMLSSFVTEMGKIHHRSHTNLTMKNQRKIAKAIRRAKMMGVIPIMSKPPRNRPYYP